MKRLYHRLGWLFQHCRGCNGFNRSVHKWNLDGAKSWYCIDCVLKTLTT